MALDKFEIRAVVYHPGSKKKQEATNVAGIVDKDIRLIPTFRYCSIWSHRTSRYVA